MKNIAGIFVALLLSIGPGFSQTPCSPGAPLPGWGYQTYITSIASQKLTPGAVVASIDFCSPSPQSIMLKIIKRNSAGSVDVVVDAAQANTGGSVWQPTSVTFTVPMTGDYYPAVYLPNSTNIPVSMTGQYAAGNITGASVGVATAAANYPPIRITYAGGGGSGGGGGGPLAPATTLVIPNLGQSLGACYNIDPAPYVVRHTGHIWSVDRAGALQPVTSGKPAGCDGTDETYLVPLADMLLDDQPFTDIVLVPRSIGGTYLINWSTGGAYNALMPQVFTQLSALGLSTAKTLFQIELGTQDALAGTLGAAATARLQSILAATAPASASFVYLEARANGPDLGGLNVRAAQRGVVDNVTVFQGPDTDVLGNEYRRDGIHFGDISAQARIAKNPIAMWLRTH